MVCSIIIVIIIIIIIIVIIIFITYIYIYLGVLFLYETGESYCLLYTLTTDHFLVGSEQTKW